MKTVIKLITILIVAYLISCTGNTKKEPQGGSAEKDELQENPYPEIKSKEEFNSLLKELGIDLVEGLEFSEFKSEILQGTEDKFPSVFRCVYKVEGKNYKANEDSLLNYYTRLFNERLKSKGWTNSSRPGIGILDFHNFAGKIKTVSIRITSSDESVKTGKQELSIELWAR